MIVPAPPPGLPPLLKRFYWILSALIQGAAELGGNRPSPVIVRIVQRMCLLRGRFTRLAERVLAGRYRPSPPRVNRRPKPEAPKPPDIATRPAPLPPGWGWTIRHVPQVAVACGTYLCTLLDEPEMADLLARAPGLRRMLRPLMRSLGQPPHPALKEPARAVAVTTAEDDGRGAIAATSTAAGVPPAPGGEGPGREGPGREGPGLGGRGSRAGPVADMGGAISLG